MTTLSLPPLAAPITHRSPESDEQFGFNIDPIVAGIADRLSRASDRQVTR